MAKRWAWDMPKGQSMDMTERKAIADILTASMEDTELTDTVATFLSDFEGKPLTKRHADKLTEITGVKWFINKDYGMTKLQTRAWAIESDKGPSVCLTLAHHTVNVAIPSVKDIKDRNPAYFDAAVERNKKRREFVAILTNPEYTPANTAYLGALDAVKALGESYRIAVGLCGGMSHDTPDWYTVMRHLLPEEITDPNRQRYCELGY